jgi:hypothetical protein
VSSADWLHPRQLARAHDSFNTPKELVLDEPFIFPVNGVVVFMAWHLGSIVADSCAIIIGCVWLHGHE